MLVAKYFIEPSWDGAALLSSETREDQETLTSCRHSAGGIAASKQRALEGSLVACSAMKDIDMYNFFLALLSSILAFLLSHDANGIQQAGSLQASCRQNTWKSSIYYYGPYNYA